MKIFEDPEKNCRTTWSYCFAENSEEERLNALFEIVMTLIPEKKMEDVLQILNDWVTLSNHRAIIQADD